MNKWIILILPILVFSFSQQENNTLEIKKEIEIQANQYRLKQKKSELMVSECLNKAAQNHAEYLVDKKELSHFQNKKETKTPTDRVNLIACKNYLVLENVAYFEYQTIPSSNDAAKTLIDLWIKSKGHRANLLNKLSGNMGTAVTIDTKNKRIIAVQVFTN